MRWESCLFPTSRLSLPLSASPFLFVHLYLYLARRKLRENSIGFMGMGCPRRPGRLQTHVASLQDVVQLVDSPWSANPFPLRWVKSLSPRPSSHLPSQPSANFGIHLDASCQQENFYSVRLLGIETMVLCDWRHRRECGTIDALLLISVIAWAWGLLFPVFSLVRIPRKKDLYSLKSSAQIASRILLSSFKFSVRLPVRTFCPFSRQCILSNPCVSPLSFRLSINNSFQSKI